MTNVSSTSLLYTPSSNPTGDSERFIIYLTPATPPRYLLHIPPPTHPPTHPPNPKPRVSGGCRMNGPVWTGLCPAWSRSRGSWRTRPPRAPGRWGLGRDAGSAVPAASPPGSAARSGLWPGQGHRHRGWQSGARSFKYTQGLALHLRHWTVTS